MVKKYPTISAVGPLLSGIKAKIETSHNDLPIIREVKKILAADLDKRYNNPDIVSLLNVSSYSLVVAWLLKCNISRLFYELQNIFLNNAERIFLVFKTDFLYHQNTHFIL